MARQLNAPVLALSTSGTAAANFLPSVVEARLSRIPLLVLTADRPPELRDWGAAQTIDQIQLGTHVKWFVDMPVPWLTMDSFVMRARPTSAADSGHTQPGRSTSTSRSASHCSPQTCGLPGHGRCPSTHATVIFLRKRNLANWFHRGGTR